MNTTIVAREIVKDLFEDLFEEITGWVIFCNWIWTMVRPNMNNVKQ